MLHTVLLSCRCHQLTRVRSDRPSPYTLQVLGLESEAAKIPGLKATVEAYRTDKAAAVRRGGR